MKFRERFARFMAGRYGVDALNQGFHRDVPPPDADQEVNLVLLEREEAEKKAKAAAASALSTLLQRLSAYILPQKKP